MQYQVEKTNKEASTRLRNAQKYYRVKNFLEAALEARAGLHAYPDDGALVTDELKAELGYTLAASLMFEGEHEAAVVEGKKVRDLKVDDYMIEVLNAVTLAETLRRLKHADEAREMGEAALRRIKAHNKELAVKEIGACVGVPDGPNARAGARRGRPHSARPPVEGRTEPSLARPTPTPSYLTHSPSLPPSQQYRAGRASDELWCEGLWRACRRDA